MVQTEQQAQIEAGDRLLLGADDTPPRPIEALALYQAQAGEGNALAAHRLALTAAQGIGRRPDWSEALDWLARAAASGDGEACAQLGVLAGLAHVRASDAARVRAAIDLRALLSPGPVRTLRDSPRIGVIEGFAPRGARGWRTHRRGRASGIFKARSGCGGAAGTDRAPHAASRSVS